MTCAHVLVAEAVKQADSGVKLATVQRFQQQNPVLHLVIEKVQCSVLIVAGQLLNITPHLQRSSLPQHSVGLCRRPGVGCKKFPSEYPKL